MKKEEKKVNISGEERRMKWWRRSRRSRMGTLADVPLFKDCCAIKDRGTEA